MKKTILAAFALTCFWSLPGRSLDTNLFEKEEVKVVHFTSKVRVVRDSGDEAEVFFEGEAATGAYTLTKTTLKNDDYVKAKKLLETSRKPNGPHVKVSAEKESKIITAVSAVEKATPASSPNDLLKQVDEVFK